MNVSMYNIKEDEIWCKEWLTGYLLQDVLVQNHTAAIL